MHQAHQAHQVPLLKLEPIEIGLNSNLPCVRLRTYGASLLGVETSQANILIARERQAHGKSELPFGRLHRCDDATGAASRRIYGTKTVVPLLRSGGFRARVSAREEPTLQRRRNAF